MKCCWLIVVICLLLFAVDAERKKPKKKTHYRLYGATNAADEQFPYAVFYIRRSGSGRSFNTCTGSIIHTDWVLTAAHCYGGDTDPRNHLVVAGSSDLLFYVRRRFSMAPFHSDVDASLFGVQERRAAAVFYHPLYDRSGSHDVGLIRVAEAFSMGNGVGIIPLARDTFEPRSDCLLLGYGLAENNSRQYRLQFISNMPARPARFCRRQRFRDVICLGDNTRGICHGDSGGPLVCGDRQRGVASHGFTTANDCGRGTVEQFYTDTERNLDWIDSVFRSAISL